MFQPAVRLAGFGDEGGVRGQDAFLILQWAVQRIKEPYKWKVVSKLIEDGFSG